MTVSDNKTFNLNSNKVLSTGPSIFIEIMQKINDQSSFWQNGLRLKFPIGPVIY